MLKQRQVSKEIPNRIKKGYNPESIEREIVADFVGEVMLGGKDAAKAKDGRTILYATSGKIKKVGNVQVNSLKIRGSGLNSNFDIRLAQNNPSVKNNISEEGEDYSISATTKEPSYANPNLKPKNKAHKDVKYWYKFKNEIVFDGVPYTVTFSIRDKGVEQYQYFINFKENKTSGLSNTAVKNLLRADQTSCPNSISDKSNTVKNNISDNSEDYSDISDIKVEFSLASPAQQARVNRLFGGFFDII